MQNVNGTLYVAPFLKEKIQRRIRTSSDIKTVIRMMSWHLHFLSLSSQHTRAGSQSFLTANLPTNYNCILDNFDMGIKKNSSLS